MKHAIATRDLATVRYMRINYALAIVNAKRTYASYYGHWSKVSLYFALCRCGVRELELRTVYPQVHQGMRLDIITHYETKINRVSGKAR